MQAFFDLQTVAKNLQVLQKATNGVSNQLWSLKRYQLFNLGRRVSHLQAA